MPKCHCETIWPWSLVPIKTGESIKSFLRKRLLQAPGAIASQNLKTQTPNAWSPISWLRKKKVRSVAHPILNLSLLRQTSTINYHFSQQVYSTVCIDHFFLKKNWVFLPPSLIQISLDICLHGVSFIEAHFQCIVTINK